ncbi:ElyC/SanA/YdcF family protein [Thalassotalea sp. PP2-459]|uniref:ElyC/SanA/YdcF family protein n=1 Tax=Thalassotalea sp. PP2-459 TaxID=1742724 RepID=UPI0009F87BF6|nr:ElyC/SanA/YdcF family protein [Thalassotalea sp. PP2-459]
MDLFLLKKIIGFLLMPMSIVVLLMLLALLLFNRARRWSFRCLFLSSILLIFLSTPWVSDRLMAPIEANYESFTKQTSNVDFIVILGCGHTTDLSLPATSQLKACSLQRMVEGLRIYHLHPEAQFITSGAALSDPTPNAVMVKNALISLGVPNKKIFVQNFPKDTKEESEIIAPRVKGKNVVLVTNADHMPRSVAYFKQQGVAVIPAPASPWVKGLDQEKKWAYFLPQAESLKQSTNAWYETLGRIVQFITG